MEPRNLFNENFVDSYPQNLSSAKLRCYTVPAHNAPSKESTFSEMLISAVKTILSHSNQH